jgi:hypothetical protein
MQKQPKSAVDYTPKAKPGGNQCQWCSYFYSLPNDVHRCTRVEGDIRPQGWCKLFKANSS